MKVCGITRKRTRSGFHFPKRALIILVPMFLIISSSVYPAIVASTENRDAVIIAKVFAQLDKKRSINNVDDTSGYHSSLPSSTSRSPSPIASSSSSTYSLPILSPSSLTTLLSPVAGNNSPIHPPPASSGTFNLISNTNLKISKVDDIITPAAINAGDLVHVVWQDDTPGSTEIFYKRDGADFDPTTVNLSNNAGFSDSPTIAVTGNNVHIVWHDNSSGNFEVLYRRSTDGGATFSSTINLSMNSGFSGDPRVAIVNNIVHVVWNDATPGNNDIFYRRSTDGGASFTEPIKNLSSNTGSSFRPAISAAGTNVYVVWDDNTAGNFDILYRKSQNGGSTFPNIIKNLSGNIGSSISPAIATSGIIVHVVWQDDTSGNPDILYRRSVDGGATFPNIIKNLSTNPDLSASPAIAARESSVHVVWHESPGAFAQQDIKYRRSLDNGATFPNIIKNLSNTDGFSQQANIALADSNVYVVWEDATTVGNFEVLYRTSSNNGNSFPSILTNLSTNTGDSQSPTIAVSS